MLGAAIVSSPVGGKGECGEERVAAVSERRCGRQGTVEVAVVWLRLEEVVVIRQRGETREMGSVLEGLVSLGAKKAASGGRPESRFGELR